MRALSNRKAFPVESHLGSLNVFEWEQGDLDRTAGVNFRGDAGSSLERKQLEMCAYAFELFGDLLVRPDRNCSANPGFETPLGIFGGGSST